MLFTDYTSTPIGTLKVSANQTGITAVGFVDSTTDVCANPNDLTESAIRQLDAYFCGQQTQFDLPLNPAGTVFQKSVWQALLSIQYGETNSYQYIADIIGNPKACRAVGAANGRNPIALIIPCHRIIGASGKLTGYAGGLDKKQWLLRLENGTQDILSDNILHP